VGVNTDLAPRCVVFTTVSTMPSTDAAEHPAHRHEPHGDATADDSRGVSVSDPANRPSLADAFEAQVALRPTAPAVRARGVEITYEDLNARANTVGRAVLERIGQAQMPVCVAVGDDIGFIAAMFGVIKTGNILMPLSLDDPPGRIRAMIERAGTPLIVADRERIGRLDGLHPEGVEFLPIGDDTAGASENLGLRIDPSGPATLMFTSGSTGEPKGVARPHRDWAYDAPHGPVYAGPGDRLSQLQPPSFSPATGNIFKAMLTGATLCRFDPKVGGVHRLAAWISDEGITMLKMGPSLMRRALEDLPYGTDFSTVKVLVTAAAPLLHSDVELFRRYFPRDTLLVNTLATTETGVVSQYVIDWDTVVEEGVVPVGYPEDGVEVFILDEKGSEVPPNGTGILHVAADGMAEGYWRDPEQSRAAFVPHPKDPGRIVYRTGDLATRRPDGCLLYVGRSGDRVKVAGFAVDLAEVEGALSALAPVKEAVAIPVEAEGDTRVVAYVVPQDPEHLPSARALRGLLADRLPAYAVPSTFVVIDAMPLTSRGKVDRRALPSPTRTTTQGRSAPPTDELERSLVEIWERVLGMEPIGVDDHFFDVLGGTSMQALQVFAEIARRLDRDLAPTTLLRAPTIAELADIMRLGRGNPRQISLLPIRTEGTLPPFFCLHGGGGGAFFVRDIATLVDPDRPVYGIQAAGFDGVPPPYRPVEELAARYLAEIRAVRPDGPYVLGGLSFGGLVAFEMAQQLVQQGSEPPPVVMLDTHLPSDADLPGYEDPHRHVQRMRSLGPRGALVYLVGGIWRRSVHRWRRMRVWLRLRTGRRLSVPLAEFHFWQLHSRASRQYRPNPYPGSVLFIASEGLGSKRRQQWGPLVDGSLELIQVSVAHLDLHLKPGVDEMRGTLEPWLRRVAPTTPH
jgi:amino acid adenylation domain-containing protein